MVFLTFRVSVSSQTFVFPVSTATASTSGFSLSQQPASLSATSQEERSLFRVATKRFEPFVFSQGERFVGFSIDLWQELAEEMAVDYQLYGVDTVAQLLNEVERGRAEAAIAGISITADREEALDFSHPFYESGLQILVANSSQGLWANFSQRAITVLTSPELYYGVGSFILILLVIAHTIWFSERRHNSEFPDNYMRGIWESLWWAAVTVTTVGYGDKTPKKFLGRLVGLFWMCAGYFVFAYFTASMSTIFTVQELQGIINGPEDLQGKQVATVASSTAAQYLEEQETEVVMYDSARKAYRALDDGRVAAVVYDAPALQYFASHQGKGTVKVVGPVFQPQSYGIALPVGSSYRKSMNAALLRLKENGIYDKIYEKWFGSNS